MIRELLGIATFHVVVLLPCLPTGLVAQFRDTPAPPAYALQGVTVVHADGRQDTNVNIVVRSGMIEAIGQGIEVPADAKVLDGDSLFVYPGLIDAYGTAEVAFPEIERGDSVRSWDAPRAVQGFLPHRRVADFLNQGGAGGKEQRAKGIVASGVYPDGGLASGLGVAVLHRTDVERPWQLIVNEEVGLAMAFQGGQGVYPGTLFGVIAYLRQAFEDARRDAMIRDAYRENPGGLTMPAFDPDYDVLQQVMTGGIRVFFSVNRAEDIRRVLQLSDEYGFSPVILGGHEAWRVADELARRGVQVVIDGDFPRPNEWKPDEADSLAAEAVLEPAAAREKKRIEDVRTNASRLAAAGVQFAISSGGGEGDLLEAARLSVEYGLSESAALQAITTIPAEMLGISGVTRIDQGVSATFVAMTGPIFDEDAEVVHAFVEGGYEAGTGSGGGGEAPTVNVTGDWTFTLASGGMEFELATNLTMEPDGSVSGNVSNDQFGTAPLRGRMSGDRMTFTITISFGGQELELSGQGTVTGDRISGNGESAFGAFTLSGQRNPGGGR